MRGLIAAACLIGALPSGARAHEIPLNTVPGLLENCTQRFEDDAEYEHHLGLCLGFIKGVANAWQVAAALADDEGLMWCYPEERDAPLNQELIDITVRELRDAPADGFSAIIVIAALRRAYPCPAQQ